MALSPHRVHDTDFKAVRKGYDPVEVESFVDEVAAALETAQNEATAMEARARAAVARLQELSRQSAEGASGADSPGGDDASIRANVDESETISRTLLLAQRTADTTVAEAQAEADRLLGTARDDAAGTSTICLTASFADTMRRWPRTSNDERRVYDWAPAADVSETDGEYLIKAELPEVRKDDLNITVQEGVLTLAGERKEEKREDNEKVHRIERFHGTLLATLHTA